MLKTNKNVEGSEWCVFFKITIALLHVKTFWFESMHWIPALPY